MNVSNNCLNFKIRQIINKTITKLKIMAKNKIHMFCYGSVLLVGR